MLALVTLWLSLADPQKVTRIRLMANSAAICAVRSARSNALTELAKDKKYSAIGGAVNLAHRRALQLDLRSADELIAKIKAAVGIKPVSCGDKLVAALTSCIEVNHDEPGEITHYGDSEEYTTATEGGGNMVVGGTTVRPGCEAANVQSWLGILPKESWWVKDNQVSVESFEESK